MRKLTLIFVGVSLHADGCHSGQNDCLSKDPCVTGGQALTRQEGRRVLAGHAKRAVVGVL